MVELQTRNTKTREDQEVEEARPQPLGAFRGSWPPAPRAQTLTLRTVREETPVLDNTQFTVLPDNCLGKPTDALARLQICGFQGNNVDRLFPKISP